jgi:hypothetical protein
VATKPLGLGRRYSPEMRGKAFADPNSGVGAAEQPLLWAQSYPARFSSMAR